MLIPVSYSVQHEKTSPLWARAFADGCGGQAVPHTWPHHPNGPIAAFGTPPVWPLFDQAIAEGRDYYYGDHGFFRRFSYYRITKNATQWQEIDAQSTGERWRRLHVDTAPWQTEGRSIVICPNSPIYMARYGINAHAWCDDLVAQLRQFTDRPTIVRWKKDADQRPLRVDLHTAWMVIAFSSASAVEALAAGIPVCTLAEWASTRPMGISSIADVETPYYPDILERDQFLFTLADHQWTLPEMESGLAWRMLNP